MKSLNYILILIVILIDTNRVSLSPIDLNDESVTHCDYSRCSKTDPNKLNVHIVPHSHDDVGWRKTVDQYYYGSNSKYQKVGIQYIIDSVVDALQKSPDRRFIQVETAYLWKWYNEQNEKTKQVIHELVKNGQLEFIGGGWSMNDEGATHYNSLIDHMTWGFRRLKDIFGNCGVPTIGWQIDPFGHSREVASLFAQMNFDAFFFGKFDYQDKQNREKTKTMELIWSGSDDTGKSSSIFTNIMDHLYTSPKGFNFDLVLSDDDPIIDDRNSDEYNVDKKVNDFINYVKDFALKYTSNHVLIPMGHDFTYQYADGYFKNIDKLIKYVNLKNSSGLNLFYSTPSCYIKSVYEKNQTYTVKTDDFFPYGMEPHIYRAGYFSSRPTLKYFERSSNNFLQICKQLDSMALLKGTDEDIALLRQEMGVLQHHDAITGTCLQFVANDYYRRLTKGISKCESVIQSAFKKLMTKDGKASSQNQLFCRLLNISDCHVTDELKPFAVTIYNPIGRSLFQNIRLPVSGKNYIVKNYDGKDVPSELVPIPDYVLKIPERKSTAKYDLKFKADLPPLGFNTYFIKPLEGNQILEAKVETTKQTSVKAKSFTVLFDSNTGNLNSIELNGHTISLSQTFQYYKPKKESSAYVFAPEDNTPIDLSPDRKSKFVISKSSTEVQQTYTSWIGQTIRVYPDEDYIEFDWVIGPIPFDSENDKGKEIITKFESNLISNKIFYTDANGRQMMKRYKDFRETFNYNITEPVAGNYFPVYSRIAIKDEAKDLQMTILSDRSQGGTSLKDGIIEIMIHKRLKIGGIHEWEPLNELGSDGKGLVVRGKHYLFLSKISDAPKLHRDHGQRIFMSPLMTFVNYDNDEEYRKNFVTSYSGLSNALPPNVHLLTLEQWKDSTYLLRLEHFYESKDNSNELSKPVTVQLQKLFKSFTITNITEMTLGANQVLGSRKKFDFKSMVTIKEVPSSPIDTKDFTVQLIPMQIRTFVVNVKSL